jgi:carbon storage regulator
LRIGSDVSVTVLGMKGGQIRIGISAPRSMAVLREELYERICRKERHWHESRRNGL